MLDAQLALTSAQTNRASAQHDYTMALVQLERALGIAAIPEDGVAGDGGRMAR
jgi:outer membrane protein TolC